MPTRTMEPTSARPSTTTADARKLIPHQTTIGPNIRTFTESPSSDSRQPNSSRTPTIQVLTSVATQPALNDIPSSVMGSRSPIPPDVQSRQPTIPEQASRPGPLVPLYQSVKLRIFTYLNQSGVRTFPKEVPISVSLAAKTARNDFSSGMTEKKSIPNTPQP